MGVFIGFGFVWVKQKKGLFNFILIKYLETLLNLSHVCKQFYILLKLKVNTILWNLKKRGCQACINMSLIGELEISLIKYLR